MLNLGVSTQRLSAKAGSGFTPKKLFDNSEEGFWYDISDIRTLKENSNGTVDVTTYGQSVGYIEDKSGNGNHARQAISGARKPKYARHPAGGIRNLLTQTENFTDSAWTGYFQKPTLTTGQTDPLGGNTAMKWSAPSTTGGGNGTHGGLILSDSDGVIEDNTNYTVSVYLKASSNVTVSLGLTDGALTGVNLTTSWQRFSTTVQNNPSAVDRLFQINEQTNANVDIFIWGAQTEKSNEATPYQKVTTEYDVTEAGQPDLYYLKFDGTDDGFQIDTFSASAQGTSAFFGYSSNNVTANDYRILLDIHTGRLIFNSRTDSQSEIGYYDGAWNDVADDGDIKVLSFNLQTSDGVMRENGTALVTDTTYVEKALSGTKTIGMHNNTFGNNFGGNLYQVVLRSTECNDRDLEATEKFIATKTGVSSRVRGLATLDLNFGANTYLATNSNGVSM